MLLKSIITQSLSKMHCQKKITVRSEDDEELAFGDVEKINQVSPHRVNPKGRVIKPGLHHHNTWNTVNNWSLNSTRWPIICKGPHGWCRSLTNNWYGQPDAVSEQGPSTVRLATTNDWFYKKNSHQLMPIEDYIQDPAIDNIGSSRHFTEISQDLRWIPS